MSFNETGHAKNIAHLNEMNTIVTGFGTLYNPANPVIKVPALQSLYSTAKDALRKVTDTNQEFNKATNIRLVAFDRLRPISTTIVSALIASGATKETIDDAKGFHRKIHGRRALTAKVVPVDPDLPAPVSISASQQSYDQLIEHLAGMVAVVKLVPMYAPNEPELSVVGLSDLLTELENKNQAVVDTHEAVTTARIARNKILYAENTGLVDIAGLVKKYVLSVFKASSAEYKHINALKFRTIK
jgi:hypothetical protein